ncbi:spore coat protein [bacterium LRH843]|nr:spore coat protein [bacterium LRH843]
MSCSKKHRNTENCVCDVVESINEVQQAVDNVDCDNSCFDLMNSRKQRQLQTIPFTLYLEDGLPFEVTGFKMDRDGKCEDVTTEFFRVSKVKDCCAVLELLDDVNEKGQRGRSQDGGNNKNNNKCLELERTHLCITVDLDCFCAIQCFDPSFVID